MELSERAIQTLEKEGCTSVYEEDWEPQAQATLRTAAAPLHVIVTEGVLTTELHGITATYQAGDRWSLAPNQVTIINAGAQGCRVVIGE